MADNSSPLFTLEPLTAPITKLVETLGSGLGAAFEPRHIRRKARAQSDAAIIKAKTEIKIRNLERRSRQRIESLELRRQSNLESIASLAVKQLPAEVSQEKVSEDWRALFIIFAQDVGDKEMQIVWARLLAGEVVQPGTFSPRTLNLVRLLRPKDAELFRHFADFLWSFDGELAQVCVPIAGDDLLKRRGLSYDSHLHLQALGLISMSSYLMLGFETKTVTAIYHAEEYVLTGDRLLRGFDVRIPTDIGCEPSRLCDRDPDIEYRDLILESWRRSGIEVQRKLG